MKGEGFDGQSRQVISAFGGIYTDMVDSLTVADDGARLIVVELGAHSVIENRTMDLATYRQGYGALLDCLQASGAAIVVGTVPSLNWSPSDPLYERAEEISSAIRGEADARSIPVADIWRATRGRRDLVSADGMHPNDAGHRVLADVYWWSIEPLLAEMTQTSRGPCPYSTATITRLVG